MAVDLAGGGAAVEARETNTNAVRVSVIIPARNEETLLPRCLESLKKLSASGPPHEVIVVDNGSKDQTVAVARSLGATVIQAPPATIGAARNRGAEAACGAILAFLDADCLADPNWLVAACARFSDLEVLAAGSYPVAPAVGATWVQEAWSFLARRPPGAPARVAWLPSANLLIRASAFKEIRGFDERLESCEDADLCYRLCKQGAIVYDEALRVTHLREPPTLRHFFHKEVWHGKNSYDGVRQGRFVWKELPSLAFPAVFLIGVLAIAAGAMFEAMGVSGIALWCLSPGLLACVIPPVVYTARSILRKGRAGDAPRFLLLYAVYFAARATALVKWLLR